MLSVIERGSHGEHLRRDVKQKYSMAPLSQVNSGSNCAFELGKLWFESIAPRAKMQDVKKSSSGGSFATACQVFAPFTL